MTDNTNMSPDEVLTRGKHLAALLRGATDELDYDFYEKVRVGMVDEFPALIAALETALAENAALKAQLADARKPIAAFGTTLFGGGNGLGLDFPPYAQQSLLNPYFGKRVHVAFYPVAESEDTP